MPVDMSAKAVTTRLKRASQLRRLCLSLAKARPVGHEAVEKPSARPETPPTPPRRPGG
jgi:hypothetical protein